MFQNLDPVKLNTMNKGYTYILASRRSGALYIGVTSDLAKRVWQHKKSPIKSHTKKYNIDKLVYYEAHDDIVNAIEREKQLKRWHRQWKINLIEEHNTEWNDLYIEITS